MKVTAQKKTEYYGTRQCRIMREGIFRNHSSVAEPLARGYMRRLNEVLRDKKKKNYLLRMEEANRAGNGWIRAASEKLVWKVGGYETASLSADEIAAAARALSRKCEDAYSRSLLSGIVTGKVPAKIGGKRTARGCGFDEAVSLVRAIIEGAGFAWDEKWSDFDREKVRREKRAAAVARACDEKWWRRKIREKLSRQVEQVLRDTGEVQRKVSPYISNWGFNRWRDQQKRNEGFIKNMDVKNESTGEELSLEQCVEASISNQVNRHNELMVRMRGWEEIATAMGLVGSMLTLTAPSKYHARYEKSGALNKKYNGATPREVADYLCVVWQKIRAEWHREGIKTFGFRIAEPHHDGTPHFHFLLFFKPDEIESAWSAFKKFALAEDGEEKGANSVRCDRKDIDPEKGTAAGYIAKYVAKNIYADAAGDGEQDLEAGLDMSAGVMRVKAWASLWGIRQYQQIGAVSVTIYRELRRVGAEDKNWLPEEVEKARAAADAGDWAAFVEAMGGAFVKQRDQLLKPLTVAVEKLNRYGEEAERLLGIALRRELSGYTKKFCGDFRIETRPHTWALVKRWVSDFISAPVWREGGEGVKGAEGAALGLVAITVAAGKHEERYPHLYRVV